MTVSIRPPTDSMDEGQLVELAQSGDQEAFAELYNRYFSRVYDFLARMMRNRTEAEDVTQDTFVRAYNSIGSLRAGGSFKSWIFTIGRNTALNRLERSKRTRPLQFEAGDDEEVEMDVVDRDKFSNPDEAARASETAALVWEAAAGLSPKQYSLLDLHLRQGLDSGEIADVLGVTRNNGYVMINRLKGAVEESIGAYVMMRQGRLNCPELDRELSASNIGTISPSARRLINRHVNDCPTCQQTRAELVSPTTILGAFAPIPAATGVQGGILESIFGAGTPAEAAPQQQATPAPAGSSVTWVGRHLLQLSVIAATVGLALIVTAALVTTGGSTDPTMAEVTVRFETDTGAPVPGVEVALQQVASGESREIVTGTTDANGAIAIPPVDPGDYQLVIIGFPEQYALLETGHVSTFDVEAGQELTIVGRFEITGG